MNNDKKALIAMSGGVDSSVAAALMKENGFECMGVTMKLFDNEDTGISRENTCCSLKDVEDARSVCFKLGIPYYVFNFADKFKEEVIDKFIYCYENGMTPNPCIDCNRYLKFEKLFDRAKELSYDYVVTGHYARIEEKDGRYLLKKAVDDTKDQSYVLYSMTKEQLAHTKFPLGELTKTEVRDIADSHGFVNARKHDSQDICFVQNGKYFDFIKSYTGKMYPEGDFVDMDGNVLGRHKGIINYTIGQRKGLGLSLKKPMYVTKIDIENNKVILGDNEDLFSKRLICNNVNLISVDSIDEPINIKAKIRYAQKESEATCVMVGEDRLEVTFKEPVRAITKGQALVMYDGDIVVGGGTIIEMG